MHPSLPDLHALQHIDTQILQLKRAQAALDDGSALKKELDNLRARLAAGTSSLRAVKTELQDSELNLKALETKIKTYEKKLYSGSVVSSKELAGLEHEIELMKSTKGQFEDRILTGMDQAEVGTNETDALRKQIETLEGRLADVLTVYKTRMGELEAQIATASSQRGPAAAAVQPVVLKRYEDIRARAGGVGLAEVVDKCCAGCHTTLTPFQLREVRESLSLVNCENCNRLLYPPGEE